MAITRAEREELIKKYEMMKKFIKVFAKGRGLKSGPWAKTLKSMSEGGAPGFGGGKGPRKGS